MKAFYIAVWTKKCAYTLDVYLGEMKACEKDLRRHKENFDGPYNSSEEAYSVACSKMMELSQR